MGELLVMLLGAVNLVIGFLGWNGRLARGPYWSPLSNYTAMLSLGSGLVLTTLTSLAGRDTPLAALLSLPALTLLLFGAWCLLVRPPRWSLPEWQRPDQG